MMSGLPDVVPTRGPAGPDASDKECPVSLARFTIYVVPRGGRSNRLPAVATPADVELGWRLLAANNRDVARSSVSFPDVEACLAAVRVLRSGLGAAVLVASRTGRSDWTWRLRCDGRDIAMSSRIYQRRLQCEANGALFVALVPDAVLQPDVMAPPRRKKLFAGRT